MVEASQSEARATRQSKRSDFMEFLLWAVTEVLERRSSKDHGEMMVIVCSPSSAYPLTNEKCERAE
jgi:hypothetical protein